MDKEKYIQAKKIQEIIPVLNFVLSFYKTNNKEQGIGVAAMSKDKAVTNISLPQKYQSKLYELLLDYKKELEEGFNKL